MKTYKVQAHPDNLRNLWKVIILYRGVMLRTLFVRQWVYHILGFILEISFVMKVQECNIEIES